MGGAHGLGCKTQALAQDGHRGYSGRASARARPGSVAGVRAPRDGVEPWYLLTSEPIHSADAAWEMVLAYSRRWQVEMAFCFGKSELAMESPRLWTWERREKLLLMVTLAYAFLLSLLRAELEGLRSWLLRKFWHPRRYSGAVSLRLRCIVSGRPSAGSG